MGKSRLASACASADVKDSERFAAGQVNVALETRFTVRSSSFTRGILATDRLKLEGQTFEIKGIKEAQGRRQLIELTCARRVS